MIQQSDVEGRLRLLRYGLIVLVIVTFIVTLLSPVVAGLPLGSDFLGTAILFSVVVAVISVGIYFGYRSILQRNESGGE